MKISASIWALQLWLLSTFVNASVSKNLRASRNLVEASDATSNPQEKKIESFECTVSETIPYTKSDATQEQTSNLICETDSWHPLGRLIFSLKGDTKSFFRDQDLSYRDVKIHVPLHLVHKHEEIILGDESMEEIYMTYTGNFRRNLKNMDQSHGEKSVLVVRISDDNDESGQMRVDQSEDEVYQSTFEHGNGVKSIYEGCSSHQMIIKPVKVLTLKPSPYLCGMTHIEATNWAFEQQELKSILDEADESGNPISHKMIVVPKGDCVDFQGNEAFGQLNGSFSWHKSVSYPSVQVASIGNNLGLRDSFHPVDNQMNLFKEEGLKLCFNSAKTWYMDWFSHFHRTVRPSEESQQLKLVSFANLNKDRYVQGLNMILRLYSPKSKLYINFSQAKGMNEDMSLDDDNKIVILEQNGRTSSSSMRAVLRSGEDYKVQSWNNTGKTLVIKAVNISLKGEVDTADVKIYLESSFDTNENASETDEKDWIPPGEKFWHDIGGSQFDCMWYANKPTNCQDYGGSQFANFGKSAKQACLACQ